ncbi:calcium-activated chloride channel regulator 4A-like [Glandiceps talaboti]
MVSKVCTLILFLVAVFAVSVRVSCERNSIYLENNEYTGLLIAINERIPEDPTLVDRIKTIFTEASDFLYESTKHRAYLKNVTILIPRTWSDALREEPASIERFDLANVIVDEANPEYGDNPYTRQTTPCGEEADYIHLTERWVIDESYSQYYWGVSGKVIVHEWGHLRWGLFDEYPVDDDEHFYYDENGQIQPTRCSKDIKGQSRDIYDGYSSCNTDPDSGVMPGPGCRFFPDFENSATSSYMYANYLNVITDFCHSEPEGTEKSRHNQQANNKQNKQCDYRSAWDVMLTTPDFRRGANPPRRIEDTTPTFRVVQEVEMRVVLVLDVSWSMTRENRLELLHQASTRYLRYVVPNNTWVGIVEFASEADTLSQMVLVDGNEIREELISMLPSSTQSHTCIGCGLLEGVKILRNGPYDTAAGGILFLITDGKENTSPLIDDVIDKLVKWKVVVDSLALSEDADPQLVELSDRTGGRSYYYSGSAQSTVLHDALIDSITSRTGSNPDTSVQLTSFRSVLPSSGMVTKQVHIDATIGRDTQFMFFYVDIEVEVTIQSPSGVTYTKHSTVYRIDQTLKAVVVNIPGNAEVGEWSYTITNDYTEDQAIQVSIESKSLDASASPIRIQSTLSSHKISESPPMAVIYADVRQGHIAVKGAVVIATVERPAPHESIDVRLHDRGTGADINKDDGVYSGYFVDFVDAKCNGECRYSVRVTASDLEGTAQTRTSGMSGAMPSELSVIPEKTDPVPVGGFDRSTLGGVLQVDEQVQYSPAYQDLFAPDKIKDLKVHGTSYSNSTVTLTWTAVGDDFDRGQAERYEMYFGRQVTDIFTALDEGNKVSQDSVAGGNIHTPMLSGQREQITIQVMSDDHGFLYYFCVIAVDDAGNKGPPSNIVLATLVPNVREPNSAYAVDDDDVIMLVLGLSIAGVFVLVVVMFVITWLYIKRRERAKEGGTKSKIVEGQQDHDDDIVIAFPQY